MITVFFKRLWRKSKIDISCLHVPFVEKWWQKMNLQICLVLPFQTRNGRLRLPGHNRHFRNNWQLSYQTLQNLPSLVDIVINHYLGFKVERDTFIRFTINRKKSLYRLDWKSVQNDFKEKVHRFDWSFVMLFLGELYYLLKLFVVQFASFILFFLFWINMSFQKGWSMEHLMTFYHHFMDKVQII